MPEPSVEVMSMKLNVVLPTVAEKGGGPNFGRPGSTGSEKTEHYNVIK